jgi:magnesium-transporting ATPase (P-type)
VERTLEFADNQRMFKVRRKGEQTLMQYEKIVQGDIVYLQEGDSFKFDGIILEIV